jgi:hypothetical protein
MMQIETEKPETASDWPPQVELIMSALDTGQFEQADRRQSPRQLYRVKARLRLFSDPPRSAPWVVYTRDIDARGVGFLSPHRLPLGYGGSIDLPDATGQLVSVNCTLLRCREAAPGWYEGALYFNREQRDFGRSFQASE